MSPPDFSDTLRISSRFHRGAVFTSTVELAMRFGIRNVLLVKLGLPRSTYYIHSTNTSAVFYTLPQVSNINLNASPDHAESLEK